jgi:nucleotide-binding universal stress UspA family protein
MISRILVAVDDSPAALAAARLAVGLAARLPARVLAVHVLRDHLLSDLVASSSARPDVARRRSVAGDSVLRHVVSLGEQAPGVEVEARLTEGESGPAVLAEARAWNADLVVVGRSVRTGLGEAYLGRTALHVLEFAEVPVLVGPPVVTG